MKRLFITTEPGRFKGLFKDTEFENNANELIDKGLPQEIKFAGLTIIVQSDKEEDWSNFNISVESGNIDYILYHESSSESVIKSIKKSFTDANYVKFGKHETNQPHYGVFKIVFNNNLEDKATKILEELQFDDEEVKRRKELEALIHLKKNLTLLPLKGNWSNETFTAFKKEFENSEKIKAAIVKLGAISFKEPITDFLKQLEPIETEIIKLTTAK